MTRAEGLKGVIIQAAVDWNFLKQRPHHLAQALADRGLPVLYIENTGTRVPNVKDAQRIWNRLRRILARKPGAPSFTDQRVEVLSPSVLPFPFLPAAQAYNRRYLKRRILAFLDRHHLALESVAMITYMATPVAADLTLALPWLVRVYDVVSDPKHVEPRVAGSEARLLREADLVLFASETLRQAYCGGESRFQTFRDGFSHWLHEEGSQTPASVDATPAPRFLYLGGLNRKVWTEALEQLADAFPSASILLVGPVAPGEIRPPQRPNVRFFPPVAEYRELAGLLRGAELALIPYMPDGYVSPMYPAKVNEYLVFGLPIVATASPELTKLAAEIGPGAIYLAESSRDFPAMAMQALNEDSPVARERRMAFTAARTWASQAEVLVGMLEDAARHFTPPDREMILR